MLKSIFLVTLLFSVSAMAQPKYLEGAQVTVTLKNGKTYTYSSEEMAVVKRNNLTKYKPLKQFVKHVDKAFKEERIVPNKKTRVYLLGGYGSTGDLDVSTNGSKYQVEHDKGFVGGVGVQRKLNNKVNVGVQVQSNGTTSLSVGHDF
jgi:hypothetical protein